MLHEVFNQRREYVKMKNVARCLFYLNFVKSMEFYKLNEINFENQEIRLTKRD